MFALLRAIAVRLLPLCILTPVTAFADSSRLIELVLRRMDDNLFVTQRDGEQVFRLEFQGVSFLVQHREDDNGKQVCTFTEKAGGADTLYFDLECDGTLDGMRLPGATRPDKSISDEDRGAYHAMLTKMNALMIITKAYKSVIPDARRMLFPDTKTDQENLRLIGQIHDAIEKTTLARPHGSDAGITFVFGEGTLASQFSVDVGGRSLAGCSVRENQKGKHQTYYDRDCDGFFERFQKSRTDRYRNSDFGNSVVVQPILQDVLAFAEFAARYYPRQAVVESRRSDERSALSLWQTRGPFPDTQAGIDEWRALAEEGNASAQLVLGVIHALGKGMERNDGLAESWLTKSAENGNTTAQYNLGVLHVGKGEFAVAYTWFYIAWRRAQGQLGMRSIQNRNILSGVLMTDDRVKAERDATDWLEDNVEAPAANLPEDARIEFLELPVPEAQYWRKAAVELESTIRNSLRSGAALAQGG